MKQIFTCLLVFYWLTAPQKVFAQVNYPCGNYNISLDGTSNYGYFSTVHPVADFTLAAWVQVNDPVWEGKEMNIFHREHHDIFNLTGDKDALGLYLDTDGQFKFRTYISIENKAILKTISSGVKPKPGTWYHVAVTFQGEGNCKLYINGKISGSAAFGGKKVSVFPYTDMITIGSKLMIVGSSVYNFVTYKGFIDEVAYSSKALTQQAIQVLANGVAGGDLF